jgi:hypothetical protein
MEKNFPKEAPLSETCTRICGYCQQEKSWVWNQQKLKDGSRIYANAEGKRWAGRRCPDCERSRVQAAVRCDSFERDIIVRQLEDSGYTIVSSTLPIKVKMGEEILTVGIKRAFTHLGRITIESSVDPDAQIFALVFESVRICTADQMERLSPQLGIYAGARQGGYRGDNEFPQ